jgi:hypothetical protein
VCLAVSAKKEEEEVKNLCFQIIWQFFFSSNSNLIIAD